METTRRIPRTQRKATIRTWSLSGDQAPTSTIYFCGIVCLLKASRCPVYMSIRFISERQALIEDNLTIKLNVSTSEPMSLASVGVKEPDIVLLA